MVLGGKQQTPLGISYHVSQDPPATCRKLTELPKKIYAMWISVLLILECFCQPVFVLRKATLRWVKGHTFLRLSCALPGPFLFMEYQNSLTERVFEVVQYLQLVLQHLGFRKLVEETDRKNLSIKFDCNCAILVRLKPVVGSPNHVLEMFSRVVPDIIRHLNIECSSPRMTQWWLSLWGIYFVAFAVADSYAPMWDGPCQLQTLFHGTMCDDNGTSPFCFWYLARCQKNVNRHTRCQAAVAMHFSKRTHRGGRRNKAQTNAAPCFPEKHSLHLSHVKN